MERIIISIVLGVIAILCFFFCARQFKNKGFLFNNAYIYASEQERKEMDKKPYYKQSGTVFLMIGICFLINALEAFFQTGWLLFIVIAIAFSAITYAIVSSVLIEKRKSKKC